MKICILNCGLKRCYDTVSSSLHENLINVLLKDGNEVHSFVHSDKPLNIHNLKGTITSDAKTYPDPSANAANACIPHQFSRFSECYYNLVVPFMDENDIKYDFFICTRPDNFYFKNCMMKKIDECDMSKINVRMRIYPEILNLEYHTGVLEPPSKLSGEVIVDDQFCIIPKKIANIAFSVKHGNFPVLVGEGSPEQSFTRLWNSNNLGFKLLPINVMIHNWRHDGGQKIYKKRKEFEEDNTVRRLCWRV
tara:strand:- start:1 stop:747 length:747 start_codon:yes stop_codon:yes gene_type:complete